MANFTNANETKEHMLLEKIEYTKEPHTSYILEQTYKLFRGLTE